MAKPMDRDETELGRRQQPGRAAALAARHRHRDPPAIGGQALEFAPRQSWATIARIAMERPVGMRVERSVFMP